MSYSATDTAGGGAVHSNLRVIGGQTIIEGTLQATGATTITNNILQYYDSVDVYPFTNGETSAIDVSDLNLVSGVYAIFFLIYNGTTFIQAMSGVMFKSLGTPKLFLSCYDPGFLQINGNPVVNNSIIITNLYPGAINIRVTCTFIGSSSGLGATQLNTV